MRNFVTVLLFVLCASVIVAQTPKGPEGKSVPVKDTKVSIIPPKDFVPSGASDPFHGFVQAKTGSFVAVVEVPTSYTELAQGLTKEAIEEGGRAKLLNKEDVTVNGLKGILLNVQQPDDKGTNYLKWILLLGDPKQSLMVQATFPEKSGDALSQEMKSSVLSAKWSR